MKISLSRSLLFLFILVLPVFAQAGEPVYHSAHSILFEIIEDGAISSKRVSLDFDANNVDGTIWAECRITIITINNNGKQIQTDNYYTSTDQATIRNLIIDPDKVSLDMIPYPLAPDHPLKLVATRIDKTHLYNAKVVGLWTDLLTNKKSIQIEWRQVVSKTEETKDTAEPTDRREEDH
jgi:hypothetical protein